MVLDEVKMFYFETKLKSRFIDSETIASIKAKWSRVNLFSLITNNFEVHKLDTSTIYFWIKPFDGCVSLPSPKQNGQFSNGEIRFKILSSQLV